MQNLSLRPGIYRDNNETTNEQKWKKKNSSSSSLMKYLPFFTLLSLSLPFFSALFNSLKTELDTRIFSIIIIIIIVQIPEKENFLNSKFCSAAFLSLNSVKKKFYFCSYSKHTHTQFYVRETMEFFFPFSSLYYTKKINLYDDDDDFVFELALFFRFVSSFLFILFSLTIYSIYPIYLSGQLFFSQLDFFSFRFRVFSSLVP